MDQTTVASIGALVIFAGTIVAICGGMYGSPKIVIGMDLKKLHLRQSRGNLTAAIGFGIIMIGGALILGSSYISSLIPH